MGTLGRREKTQSCFPLCSWTEGSCNLVTSALGQLAGKLASADCSVLSPSIGVACGQGLTRPWQHRSPDRSTGYICRRSVVTASPNHAPSPALPLHRHNASGDSSSSRASQGGSSSQSHHRTPHVNPAFSLHSSRAHYTPPSMT